MFQYFFFFPATKFLFYIIYESCTCPYTCKRLHRTHTLEIEPHTLHHRKIIENENVWILQNRHWNIVGNCHHRRYRCFDVRRPTEEIRTPHTQPNVGCFSLAATEDEHWAPVATTAVQNFCLLLSWRVNKAWPSQFRSQSHFLQERNKKTNLTERDID